MKLAVCLKRIPAPDGNIRLSVDGRSFDCSLVDAILNPPDEYALEAALRIRALDPASKLLAISVGPRGSESVLRQALAVGADDATLVEAPDVNGASAAARASEALRPFSPDLVLCGRQAIDDQQGLFPAALAEALGLPHLNGVCALGLSGDGRTAICRRHVDGGKQEARIELPGVVACDRMAHELRVPTLRGRLESRKRPLTIVPSGSEDPKAARHLSVPSERHPRHVWTVSPNEAVAALLKDLREVEGFPR